MDERIRFWSNPAQWPVNVPGYEFAARAVLEVGRAKYGEDWVGTEPVSPNPYALPNFALPDGRIIRLSQSSAKPWQKESINALLRNHRSDLDRKPAEYGPYGPKPLLFTDDEWAAGLDLAAQADKELVARRGRFNAALELMTRACGNGKLVSALRPKEGGKMGDPLPPHFWHMEPARAFSRFFWCQMNPNKPFDTGVGGDAYQLIYFSRESVDALLLTLPTAAAESVSPQAAPKAKKRTSSQRGAIDRALAELWDGTTPSGLTVQRRDEEIRKFAKSNGLSVPDPRTIRRYFQDMTGQ